MKHPHIKKAEEILGSINFVELNNAGFVRDKHSYDFIVQYPPPLTLKPMPNWESEGEITKPAEVYVHIPFCTGVCSYCHYARASDMPHLVDDYLELLKKELSLRKKLHGEIKANSIYLGGGTPTYLKERQLSDIISHLIENLQPQGNIEVTVEASPETLSKEKLRALKDAGVNRLSVGVQAFDDHLLIKVCGRRHNERMAVEAVNQAKKAEFENGVNVDLIYGLPDQMLESWMHTLDTIEELSPEYVTTYHLRIKKGTRINNLPPERFPSEYNTLLMYASAIERLTDLGYTQISPNQFAKDGYVFRHQERKWRNNHLLGFGVSAYGYVNNTVYHNFRSIQDYGDELHKEQLPVHIGKKLSKPEQITRAIIFGLKLSGVNRKDGGLNKSEFEKAYGTTMEEEFGGTLSRLKDLGLTKTDGDFLSLTYKGILLSDEVCREFYSSTEREYLKQIGHAYGREVF